MTKLAPINQVIVFRPTRLPLARLDDVNEKKNKPNFDCAVCAGTNDYAIKNKFGEYLYSIPCPECGG